MGGRVPDVVASGLLDMFAPMPSGVASDTVTARLAVAPKKRSLRAASREGAVVAVSFLGTLEAQVVIARIAVRHDHHLAPRLVEQRSHRRQGRARR